MGEFFEKSKLALYFNNHTLGFGHSPNGAKVFYYFKSDGTLFRYEPDQIGPEPPRRGDTVVGKWQIREGLACLEFSIQSACYDRKKDAYSDQYILVEASGNSRQTVTSYAKGDALELEDSVTFYDAYNPHELIGKRVFLFAERASRFYNAVDARLRHGSEFLEAEVLGYRDSQNDYNPEGFLVRIVGSHQLEIAKSGDQFGVQFIPLEGCLNQMCREDIQFALSPRLIHQMDFGRVLEKIYIQIEDKNARWDSLTKAVGIGVAVVAAGVVIHKIIQQKDQASPSSNDPEADGNTAEDQETPEEKIKRLEEELARLRHDQGNSNQQSKPDPNQKLLGAPANDNDPYSVLGVSKTASKTEIRKAYLNLVKTYHPDLYQQKSESEKQFAESQLKRINSAYGVLTKGK